MGWGVGCSLQFPTEIGDNFHTKRYKKEEKKPRISYKFSENFTYPSFFKDAASANAPIHT